MTYYTIRSEHETLAAAVAAAGLDLSYNEKLAQRHIASLDRDPAFKRAYVLECETGEIGVWFDYHCDIKLLNEYKPFVHCLHDGSFRIVTRSGNTVTVGEPRINRKARKLIAEYDLTVAA